MIRFVAHKDIDKKKWDACISNSVNASIFVYSWYLDAVCENWMALILGDYEAVFPMAVRSKYRIAYLYQPFFTRYFGVYSKQKISEKLVDEFLQAIPANYKLMEFCLHEQNGHKATGFETKERCYQELDLAHNYETIAKQYSDNAKRNVKKGIKAGLTIRPDLPPEKIVGLFRETKGNELEIFDAQDYKILIRLMNKCVENRKGHSIAVYDGDILCAAAFFMFSNNRFVFLKSGVTPEGKAKGAMHLLFDQFIRENSGHHYTLDFGGSSVDSVARFYKNFGAKDCVYLQVKKSSLPRLLKWVKSLKNKV